MAKKVQLEVEIKGNDSVAQASEKTKALRDNIQKLKETLATGGLGEKEYQKANEQLQKYEERLKKTENTTKSMTSELRSLTQLIASGKLKGEELINAQMAAGKLKDAIADAKQEVNNFASDTRKLDAFLQLGQGIAGGFAAAQGAMALFGSENEDLQKSLIKIQSSVAVLNGVQAVANSLNKSSAAMTELQSIRLKVLTAVQARYTAVVGTTTGAMKLLRLAGATLGIGLIVTAIGLLIANFDKIKKAVLNFIPALANIGELFTKVKNAVMDFVGISSEAERQEEKSAKQRAVRSQQMQYEIELMEANGASARDLYLAKRKLLFNDLETLKIAAFKEGATQDEIKAYNDLVQAIRVLDAEENKRIKEGADKEKEASNKRAEERKKEQDRIKAEREKEKHEALKRADDDIKEQLKRFDDEQAKLKQARLDAEFELEDEKDRQAQRDRERAEQLSQEIIDAEKSVQDARLESIIAAGQLIGQLAGQNKKIATAALAIEKGAAIADVIIKGIRERAGITAKYSLVPGGQAAALPELAASRIRTGISIASIAAAGIQGARSISGGGSSGGGSVQPPNIRGSQTTNEPTSQPATKVFVTETDIRSKIRKVDGIYSQATIQ
jgi:chromosome segregation ATPase